MEVVAHRAGNSVAAATAALGQVDMIELDVHVLRGRVEVRHAKVLHPTRRLWEKWYLLPRGSTGVAIEAVLSAIPETTPLMIDLKCFTNRSSRRILATLPAAAPVIVSTRNWWVLKPFERRPNTRRLRSCGTRWQLWWVLHRSVFGSDVGVCIHERRLTPKVIAELQRTCTSLIFTWGLETSDRVRELAALGISGVIADDYRAVSADSADG